MGPVYALMRCVDNALIGQQGQHKVATRGKGGDEVQTRDVLFDQASPDPAGAHLAQGQGHGISDCPFSACMRRWENSCEVSCVLSCEPEYFKW